MKKYDHSKIENKWQKQWAKDKLYQTPDSVSGKDNFYLLVEFPYPSGNLHVGHWYAFAVPDILARHLRMAGKNVMYPIGFDAFGLPAENAAIKNKLNPRTWTEKNIEYMTKQIESMGTSFDWSRAVSTIDPKYYKWTQWLFLQLFKKSLAYQKETAVNWCPKDKTVLANEQVIGGLCERCDSPVEQRLMLQWNIKITDYADRLIDDLKPLDWPEEIKESQRNWIGRSEGAEIDFPLMFDGDKKYKYVYLHGWTSGADRPRNHWYRAGLEAVGHEVVIPDLPNTKNPVEEEQVEAALACTEWDENTIVVGHSLGGTVAMKALQKLGKPIAGMVLIAPAMPPGIPGSDDRPFHKTFDWNIDYEKLKSLTKYRTVLSDLQEDFRTPYLRDLASKLDARLVETKAAKKHFEGDKEPDVLMWLRPTIRVFTTRPDTLFGATYLVLAPEHLWVKLALGHKTVLKNNNEVQAYVERANKKTELERQENKEKTGVELKGVVAINPATGEKIPMYVADYVLGHYGTGAIMAVPAHDERDFEFAQKFGLPTRYVIAPRFVDQKNPWKEGKEVVERHGIMGIVYNPRTKKYLGLKWKQQPWTTFVIGGSEAGESPEEAARREIAEETGYKNLRLVRTLGGPIRAEFFAAHKDVNRLAYGTAVLFELADDEAPERISKEEQAKHEAMWLSDEEVSRDTMMHSELDLVIERIRTGRDVYTGDGVLVNSDGFNGFAVDEAKKKITEKYGQVKKTYRLRDWIVSRQRYWGVPIPIIHCEKCGPVAVPDEKLPVKLPEVEDYLPTGDGKSPLAKVESFVKAKCPQCGGVGKQETDTLDTFVDSSWYFLRYTDPRNSEQFAARDKQDDWMPIDLYSGGPEHTTMHVLYSRFWHKALFDMGLVAEPEPYARRMNHGIVLGPDNQKMSKSRGNVVDPDEIVARLGADTVRMYLAFIGPYNEVGSYPWNPDGVVGVRRFLERTWRAQEVAGDRGQGTGDSLLTSLLHKTIKKVTDDIVALKFNTAIAQMMVFLNAVEKEKAIGMEDWKVFLRLLAPFAPHMAEELWHEAGETESIHAQPWPSYDPAMLIDEEATIAVQIDGKTRGEVKIARDASKEMVEEAAKGAVGSRLVGQHIMRTIVVPGRLVNFVLKH